MFILTAIYGDGDAPSNAVRRDMQAAVSRVDQQMSLWITRSAVNNINAATVGDWVDIPQQTADGIVKAIQIENRSGAITTSGGYRHFDK